MCNATCLHKLSFGKLAEQQIPYQACKLAPVKRDTGNATIHRNGTKPAPFASNRGYDLNDLGLVRFHRAAAENWTFAQNLIFVQIILKPIGETAGSELER